MKTRVRDSPTSRTISAFDGVGTNAKQSDNHSEGHPSGVDAKGGGGGLCSCHEAAEPRHEVTRKGLRWVQANEHK